MLARLGWPPVSSKLVTIRCDPAVTSSDIRTQYAFFRKNEATASQLALLVAFAKSVATRPSSSPSTGKSKSDISVRVGVRVSPTAEATASTTTVLLSVDTGLMGRAQTPCLSTPLWDEGSLACVPTSSGRAINAKGAVPSAFLLSFSTHSLASRTAWSLISNR